MTRYLYPTPLSICLSGANGYRLNAISQVPAVRDALHQVAETLKKYLK